MVICSAAGRSPVTVASSLTVAAQRHSFLASNARTASMALVRLAVTTAALLVASPSIGVAQSPTPLRVIRTAPAKTATPIAEINVTFDRPVAGSLDRTVDPRTILSVEPAIAGRVEWRDPVTIRL